VVVADEMTPADLGLTAETAADPRRIRSAILTHLHWDHAGCHELLPQARFVVQAREIATWTGRFAK
jgi:glyoxylase-like metal-dependent hydrolase (beta-lactamase superfamily II)